MAGENSSSLSVLNLNKPFSCIYKLKVYTYFFVIIILLIPIVHYCRVTMKGIIWRHITILDFKRLVAYIIFLATDAP